MHIHKEFKTKFRLQHELITQTDSSK